MRDSGGKLNKSLARPLAFPHAPPFFLCCWRHHCPAASRCRPPRTVAERGCLWLPELKLSGEPPNAFRQALTAHTAVGQTQGEANTEPGEHPHSTGCTHTTPPPSRSPSTEPSRPAADIAQPLPQLPPQPPTALPARSPPETTVPTPLPPPRPPRLRGHPSLPSGETLRSPPANATAAPCRPLPAWPCPRAPLRLPCPQPPLHRPGRAAPSSRAAPGRGRG